MPRPVMLLTMLVTAVAALPAAAKEVHYKQTRVLLVTEKASCVSCHVTAKSAELNLYGKALHDEGDDKPISERIMALDETPGENDSTPKRERQEKRQDVDGDGALNWIEILAGTNPGDADSKPDVAVRERLAEVVSCKMCHKDVNQPGNSTSTSNPHNEFGNELSMIISPLEKAEVSRDPREIQRTAEKHSIIERIRWYDSRPITATSSYWERIMMLETVEGSGPARKDLIAFRKFQRNQRSKSKRDETKGMGPHVPDGFLTLTK